MTPEEFQAAYPQVIAWIQKTIAAHRSSAKRVSEFGFPRLPLYVSAEFLESVSAVIVDRVPVPPLSEIGLRRFAEIEMIDHDGIHACCCCTNSAMAAMALILNGTSLENRLELYRRVPTEDYEPL